MNPKKPKTWPVDDGAEPLIWVVAKESEHVKAFAESLAGFNCELLVSDTEFPARRPAFMVTWGCRRERPEIMECRQRRVPILVLENGYIGRPVSWEVEHSIPEGGYVQTSWDRLHNLTREAIPGRLDMILKQCGMELKNPAENSNKTLLICSQVPDDSQHGMGKAQMQKWESYKAILLLKRHDFDNVVWRPHPKARGRSLMPELRGVAPIEQSSEGKLLAEEMREAKMVLTFNSNAGVEAMIEGIPVECDARCHYFGFSNMGQTARELILGRMASTQWSMKELADGTAADVIAKNFHITYNRPFPLKTRQNP